MVHDVSFGQVFHRPTEVGGINAEHGGTLADSGRKEKHSLVRLLPLETIDQVELRPHGPDGAGRSRTHRPDDKFSGTDQVGLIDDILVTLRMHDHLDVRILLPEVVHVRRLEHLMHAAMTFPQNEPRLPNRLDRIPAVRQEWIPDHHLLARHPHLVRRVPTQMLVREKQDFLAPTPGPLHDRPRIRRRTGNATMLAAEGLEDRRRVDIDHRRHGFFHRDQTSQRFPTLVHLLDGGHIGHRATGRHVRKYDDLVGAAEDVSGLRHEVDSAKDHIGPL